MGVKFDGDGNPRREGDEGLSENHPIRNQRMDQDYSKFPQENFAIGEMNKEKESYVSFTKLGSGDSNRAGMHIEHGKSNDGHEEQATINNDLKGTSPVDERNYFESDLLVAELQEASDALEEMESKVQVKLMVGEAVLKGILTAMEREASEVMLARDEELQKVKDQLQEKESIVNSLLDTFQRKEDEFAKLFEESNHEVHQLVIDMLAERESVLGKVEESEKFVPIKEKEFMKSDTQEMRAYKESRMNQQNVLEENAQMLREAEGRIYYLEQEVAVKEGLLQKYKTELGEQSRRSVFEEKILSAYVDNSFWEVVKHINDTQVDIFNVEQKMAEDRNGLEAALDEVRRGKAKLNCLKSGVAKSEFVEQLPADVRCYVGELANAKIPFQDVCSESERGKLNFSREWKEVECLIYELEETLSKKREEVVELLGKLEESDWKSHAQIAVILGLVDGCSQEWAHEFARLSEELKMRDQEVLSLRSEAKEQNERLKSDVSDLKASLLSKDQELLAFRQEVEMTSPMQRDALPQEQSTAREALVQIGDLKKLKMTLVGRLEEESQKVLQLEEELLQQEWKDRVELDMVTTIFMEGVVDVAAMWNKERAALVCNAQMHHELRGQKPIDEEATSKHVSHDFQHDAHGLMELAKSGAQDSRKIPSAETDSVMSLVRQNSELRREKEQLLEQKTDEIYKLKRDFYKALEKVKEEWKSDAELETLKRDSGFIHDKETVQEGNEIGRVAMMEKKLQDDQKRSSDVGVQLDREESHLLELISHRDEQIKERDDQIRDFSTRLSYALEKERNHVSTRASLVENLAALEKERSRLSLVHEREREELIAYYKNLDEEKGATISRATKDIEEKNKHIEELVRESCLSKDEVEVLRIEITNFWKVLRSDLSEQMQIFLPSYQQLENDIAQRMKQCNTRLQRTQSLINYLLQQSGIRSLDEIGYLQNAHNLQKAETEVDLLGDEVDALIDILEKVYSVLSHYAPIFQHYPGLAELVIVVREELLQRCYDSKED